MATRYTIRTAQVEIAVKNGLADALERRLADMDDATLKAADAAADQVAEAAFGAWPVKTGRSKRGLERVNQIDQTRGEIRVSIRNAVPYAKYVKPKTLGGRSAFVELLRKPLNKAASQLAKTIASAAAAALKG